MGRLAAEVMPKLCWNACQRVDGFMALTGMVLQLRLHPGGLLDMVKRLPPFMAIYFI